MLNLPPGIDIFLCLLPTDMRKSFDGLMRMAEEHLEQNVLEGGLFVFLNRRRDRVKCLYWDLDGLAIWYSGPAGSGSTWATATIPTAFTTTPPAAAGTVRSGS